MAVGNDLFDLSISTKPATKTSHSADVKQCIPVTITFGVNALDKPGFVHVIISP